MLRVLKEWYDHSKRARNWFKLKIINEFLIDHQYLFTALLKNVILTRPFTMLPLKIGLGQEQKVLFA